MTDQEALLRAASRAGALVAQLTEDPEADATDDTLAAVIAAETLRTLLLDGTKLRASEKTSAIMLIDAASAQARHDARAWLEELGELAQKDPD